MSGEQDGVVPSDVTIILSRCGTAGLNSSVNKTNRSSCESRRCQFYTSRK